MSYAKELEKSKDMLPRLELLLQEHGNRKDLDTSQLDWYIVYA